MAEQDFQRLLGIINQLRLELDLVNQSITTFSKRFQQTGSEEFSRVLARQRVLAEDLTKQLSAASEAYARFNRSAGAARTGEFYIPTPETESGKRGFTAPSSSRFTKPVDQDFPDIENAREQRLRLEKERLASLRATIEADKRYTHALDIATQRGFSIANLKNVYNRGTDINRLQFQKTDTSGIRQDLDLYVNQSGKATPGISNQFRTFGQGVVRDIGELTKWSIALAAVYGPLNKLSELTQTMIDNQVKLTDAVVSVSSAFLDQGQVFDIAANQAERVGEAVSGVIDAFTQSYRATGGAGNQVERLATSQKLLSDSLILSKLSTLDQAQAIDTLSAALRQSGSSINAMNNPLENGTELLDKWVRVTKIANVDLGSLATGFAVLGDAAEAAQIDADALNGVLAAIAETGVASGRELANTARAIVAGFQSEQARKELENLGVAFEDATTGSARPFLEIMKEISDLRVQGIIGDTEFSRLTLALGGGTRRQAAYATFIENFSRVGEVASESAKASGDAEAALAKQLETVQTSITKLGNAFDSLAQTMGQEGGFLSIIKGSVDGTTALVKTFDSLVSILGKATPALTAFVAASLVLKSRGVPSVQAGIGNLLSPQQAQVYNPRDVLAPQLLSQRSRGFISTNLLGTNAQSGAFQGVVAALIPALSNIFNKEDRFGATKAGANVLGGVAGGIIGSLTGAGPLIGATIGTAISEAFVNSTIARRTDLFSYTAPSVGEKGKGQPEDLDAALQEAEIGLYKSIGLGSEALGRLVTASAAKNAEAYIDAVNDAIKSQSPAKLAFATARFSALPQSQEALRQLADIGIDQKAIQDAFKNKQEIQFQPEYLAFQQASPDAQKAFREAEAARLAVGGTSQDEKTAFSQLVSQNQGLYKELLSTIRESSAETLRGERISGDVTGATYGRRAEALGGFSVKALQYYTALGDQVSKIADDTGTATEAFETLNNVIVYGSEDALPQMTSITGEISKLVNLLNNPALNEEAIEKMFPEEGIAGANAKLSELRETLANLINDANKQALLEKIDIPEISGDINKPLLNQEEALVEQRTKQLQDQFYKGFLKLPDDMYDALKDSFEEFAVPVKEFEDAVTGFKSITETDQQFRQAAIAQLMEEGKLRTQKADPFGIQQVDLPGSRAGELQAMINYFTQYLSTNFPQYEQNPEDVGVIFNDYVTSTLHGDNLAIKLALDKLVELNQKQLDGMYNIPEGATFWVPLTAAYYRNKGGGGEGGLPDVGEVADTGNTEATNENTGALRELNGTILSEKERRGQLDQFWMKNDPDRFRNKGDRPEQTIKDKQYEHLLREYNMLPPVLKSRTGEPTKQEYVGGVDRTAQRPPSFLESLMTLLLTKLGGFTGVGMGIGGGTVKSPQAGDYGAGPRTGAPSNTPAVSKLDLKLSATTNLTLDGRVLASALQTYLASDLLRTEGTQGTITKRYII